VANLGRIQDLCTFPAGSVFGGKFLHGQMWLGDSEIYGLWFSISLRLLSRLTCLQTASVSELSAREGLLFCFGESHQAVRWSHQFPTPPPFNFSAYCKFLSGVLRSYSLQALSRWSLATALWGMRNEGLSYFAAGLPCSGKLLFCYILALGLGFMGGINIVPELVLLICCGLCLANLHVGFPSPQGL
jgi:hypothetical protein